MGAFVADPDISVTESKPRVPLRFLLSSLAIAKAYLFSTIITVIIRSLKARLMPETFNIICATAIKYDVTSLRMHCLDYARSPQSGIQQMKNAGQVSPEVEMELAGIWEVEDPAPKRR